MDWWADQEKYEIDELRTCNDYVEVLMGRETSDGWEYAVVRWRYLSPHLVSHFKNGKVLSD